MKIHSPNVIFLKKAMPKEQVQLFFTSNKNYYHLLTLLYYSSNSKKFMQRRKEEGRIYHLAANLPS